ncbi:MAG: type II toxin-antitoxin system VapC family toxin [Bacillota bacterium]|nr:type II toxin-antitoxin system VapC family toxin [Bacillota bacterium]
MPVIEGYTDTEVLQEILSRYYHIKQRRTGFRVFDLFATIVESSILPVLPAGIFRARFLAGEKAAAKLSPRDLIHLAVMSNNGIAHVITADKGFEAIPGIRVISSSKRNNSTNSILYCFSQVIFHCNKYEYIL